MDQQPVLLQFQEIIMCESRHNSCEVLPEQSQQSLPRQPFLMYEKQLLRVVPRQVRVDKVMIAANDYILLLQSQVPDLFTHS